MRGVTVLVVFSWAMLGCEGDAGPAGPQGNANVVSGTIVVDSLAWTEGFWAFPIANATQGNPAKVQTIAVPAITAGVFHDGAVLVYLKVPTGIESPALNRWTLLPFNMSGFGGNYLVSLNAAAAVGEIRLGYLHIPTDAATTPPPVAAVTLPRYQLKYVAIAGVPAAAVAGYAALGDPDRVVAALRRDGW